MGAIGMMLAVSSASASLCFIYSALDMKFGPEGFLCWSAFAMLATSLAGGLLHAAASLGLLLAGKASGLEPLAVLAVSLLASKLVIGHVFPGKQDDTTVVQRPYEQEIRDILFSIDPSRLHLVDAELDRYKGREKQLLRKYEQEQRESEYREHESRRRSSEHAPFDTTTNTAVGATGATVTSRRGYAHGPARMSAVQQAHEEETRRVQEAIRQRVESLSARAASRR